MNNLDDSFFSEYKDEFNFISDHFKNFGNIPDKETFLSKFPRFMITDVHESEKYLLNNLYEDKNKRLMANTFNKVRDLLMKGDTESAMKVYMQGTENITQATRMTSVDILRDVKDRYDAYIEKTESDINDYYVSTGFKELDDLMGGWDRQEELATIVARTNQGKSWLLLKTAIAAAEQGLNVGLYSGEMSERKVGYRIDTLISNISNFSIMHGGADVRVQYKKYIDSLPNRFKGSIKVLTPVMIGGLASVTTLRAFIEKENLDMLCIDQHSLLEDDRGAKNPVERASNISKDLKNLQVLKGIPIISVCQQNRNSTDEGVDTTHIAQSDRIAQDSTAIIFFENKENTLTLNLVKSRDSANGKKIKYHIDLNTGSFTYLPVEGDGISGEDSINDLRDEFDGDISSYHNDFNNDYDSQPF